MILSFLAKKISLFVKKKIILNFMIFMATKNVGQKKIYPLLFWCCCWILNPGSEIRDPG
jgi:hypothetical protein